MPARTGAPGSCISGQPEIRMRTDLVHYAMAVDAHRLSSTVPARGGMPCAAVTSGGSSRLFVIGVIAVRVGAERVVFCRSATSRRASTPMRRPPGGARRTSRRRSATIAGAPVEHGGTITTSEQRRRIRAGAAREPSTQATRTINFMRLHLVGGQIQRPAAGRAREKAAGRRHGAHPARRPWQSSKCRTKISRRSKRPAARFRNSARRGSASSPGFTAATIAAPSSSTARSASPAAWPCRISGWDTRRTRITGATSCSR